MFGNSSCCRKPSCCAKPSCCRRNGDIIIKYHHLFRFGYVLLFFIGTALILWQAFEMKKQEDNLYKLRCVNNEFKIKVNQTCSSKNDFGGSGDYYYYRCVQVYSVMSYNVSINEKYYSGDYMELISSVRQIYDLNKNIDDALFDANNKRPIGTVIDCGYLDPQNNYEWLKTKTDYSWIPILANFVNGLIVIILEVIGRQCKCLDREIVVYKGNFERISSEDVNL